MHEPVVLVVDDEPAHHRSLRRALSGLASLREASCGAEALDLAKDGRVGLVISDQRMNGMTGVELLEEIRSRHPTTVLMLLTAYADLAALQQAVNRIGIYHYLEKPWGVVELRQVVTRGLERFGLERQRERLVAELQSSYAIVRREAEYKNRLLSVLAHELGTPVHIAVNAIGLLLEVPIDAAARRWVDALRRAGDRLARGVSQMQRASLVGGEQLRLRRRPIDLSHLAGEATAALRLAARARELEIVEFHPPGGSWVFGDAGWLHHLIWNLLTNAVRSTPDGGRIELATGADGEFGQLIVRDTGVGFAAEAREDLFVPFSSACGDPVLHGSGWLEFGARGLGLGLALSKNIVDAHGGFIGIESAKGSGTSCRVRLPTPGAGGGRA